MKKHYIVLGVVLLIVAGLAVLSISKYESAPKGLTLSQAVSQRNTAQLDLAAVKSLEANDQVAITNLKGQLTTLTNQKATLCAQIKAARLVQPLCQ